MTMQYLVILCDGMADFPLEELGGKTVMQAAEKPNLDSLALKSRMGLLETFPEGMPTGSTTANLSILGYDPVECFGGRKTEGRGFFEAASLGLQLEKVETAFRCNLMNVKGGKINSHSAGNISSKEAKEIIEFLDKTLGSEKARF